MIPITRPELPPIEDYQQLLQQIWDSRMLSNFASFSKEMEGIASGYLQVGARAVVSGDIGLVCALAALDLEPGSPVLLPSFTFNSTVNAVLWNNLIPVFVDIDADTLNLDPTEAARVAAEVDPSLIIATHVFGNPADASSLRRTCAERGIPLLFDAAHGYGSLREGVHVGGLGDVEVFSLSGTKPVTCGEGGLITSHDEELLERIEYLRAYGFQRDYNSRMLGINGKISELHAALGTLTLPGIEPALQHREAQLRRYREQLAELPGIRLQQVRAEDRSTYKDFALLFESQPQRDAVRDALAAEQVQTKEYFRPCHRMDAYFPFAQDPLPVTEQTFATILCLPLFHALGDPDIDRICEIVAGALQTTACSVDEA